MKKGAFRFPMIKIDGGGGADPDPAVYCPANGYPDPNETGQDLEGIPVITPPTGTDEIIVVIADYYVVTGNISFNMSAGNLYWEIYGEGDTLLSSGNQASGTFAYNSALLTGGYQGNGCKFYKYIFKPAVGQYFTTCSNLPLTTVKVFINAPLITNCVINTLNFLNEIWLCDAMDSLTTATYLCQYTPELRKVTLPTSMASLTSVEYWFRQTGLVELIWTCNFPSLTNIKGFAYQSNFNNVELNLSASVADISYIDASNALSGCTKLKSAIVNIITTNNVNGSGVLNSCSSLTLFELSSNFFFNSNILSNSIFANTANSIFQLNPPKLVGYANQPMLALNIAIKKMVFGENHIQCVTGLANIGGLGLEEIVFLADEMATLGTSFNTVLGTTKIDSLKKITLPARIAAPNITTPKIAGFWPLASYYPNLEELSSFEAIGFEFGMPATNTTSVIFTKLTRFDQPNLHFYTNMNINRTLASPGSFEYFDIDFEKSFIEGCSTTVVFSYQQFDATELNRIFTKFPDASVATGTGLKRIQITGNPGAATCDTSIVTAKGWTVL